MDQVGINFEWHRGAQFHQGKRTSKTIRFACHDPPAAANGQNRLSASLELTWNYFGICFQCLNKGWIKWASILSGIVKPNLTKGNGPVIGSSLP